MLYRAFRKSATGEWLNDMFTVDGDTFAVPAASHLADVAAGFSLTTGELEVVEGATDPRSGTLLTVAHGSTPQSPRAQYGAATADSERVSVIAQLLDLTD